MKAVLPILLLLWAAAGCACCDPADPPSSSNREIFQFRQDADLRGWEIEDDVVMGGRSKGAFLVNENGNAVFSGDVSLENGGGFSSLQYTFDPVDVSAYRQIVLGLKGDGKRYQLRLEAEPRARHAYAFDFDTSGDWQTVALPFADFHAIRHGDRLDLPNYPGQTLSRIQILIGNGQAESFRLEIDRIWLK